MDEGHRGPKFTPGDVVKVVKQGGFQGPVPFEGIIAYETNPMPCPLHNEPMDCYEWANIAVLLDADGRRSDGVDLPLYAWHVSECCMELSDFGRELHKQ